MPRPLGHRIFSAAATVAIPSSYSSFRRRHCLCALRSVAVLPLFGGRPTGHSRIVPTVSFFLGLSLGPSLGPFVGRWWPGSPRLRRRRRPMCPLRAQLDGGGGGDGGGGASSLKEEQLVQRRRRRRRPTQCMH